MKKAWKLPITCALITALFASGCASPRPALGPGGLPATQLHNIAEPPSSSWLPKFMQPAPAAPKFGGSGTGGSDLSASAPPKNAKPKKVEPLLMARLHEKRGQFEHAVKIYEQELATSSKKAHIHHRLAVISSRQGNWEKSRDHFTEACRLEPRNAEILSDLGYALYLQHQLPEAEACLLAAVEANPQNKSAQNNLGIVQGVLGKYDQSLAAFRRAVPEAEAHANLEYVHMQLGDAEKAMDELNQALTHDKGLKTAAIALVQMNDLKQKLTPKDFDKMLLAGKQPPTAAPGSPAPATQPAPFHNETATPVAATGTVPASPAPAVAPTNLALADAATVVPSPAPASVARTAFRPQEPVPTVAPQSTTPDYTLPRPSVSSRLLASYPQTELQAVPAKPIPPATTVQQSDNRIKELPQRLPAPTAHVNLSGLGTNRPAKKPLVTPPTIASSETSNTQPIATTAHPAQTVVQASAQQNMAPQLLEIEESKVPASESPRTIASSQPVPVFKPSALIQQSREQALAPVYKIEDGNASTVVARSAGENNAAPEQNDLVAAVQSAQAAGARTAVVKPNTGATPAMTPQAVMPRPEDMLPAQAQLNSLPTHQLHPTASPTWTAPITPTPASNTKTTKGSLPRVKVMPE